MLAAKRGWCLRKAIEALPFLKRRGDQKGNSLGLGGLLFLARFDASHRQKGGLRGCCSVSLCQGLEGGEHVHMKTKDAGLPEAKGSL